MLPTAVPDCRQISLAASMEAAREVGGDFYDYFWLGEDELCFCVADVSGKGVGAALFMAMSKLLLKSHAPDLHCPAEILSRVNADLAQDNPECMFVTVFLGTLNTRTGILRYSNAGHNPPLIRRQGGDVVPLSERHGPLLGVEEGLSYGQSEIRIEPGEILLVFTDGVTEAMNETGELYSDQCLFDTLRIPTQQRLRRFSRP